MGTWKRIVMRICDGDGCDNEEIVIGDLISVCSKHKEVVRKNLQRILLQEIPNEKR